MGGFRLEGVRERHAPQFALGRPLGPLQSLGLRRLALPAQVAGLSSSHRNSLPPRFPILLCSSSL